MSQMFENLNNIPAKNLCLNQLDKIFYGLYETLTCQYDFLEKGLEKSSFKPLKSDPSIYYSKNITLVIYINNFFGSDKN